MENFKDKKLDLTIGSVEEKDGKFYFIGEALTQDYECEDGLKALAGKTVNKHFTWRHRHPLEEKHKENHIYGIVRDSWVKDKLIVKTELYDHTKLHRMLIEDIKLRDLVNEPLSLSMHYRTYFDKEGDVAHYDVFELAGTPYPHCKECKIIETGVIKKMEEDEIKLKEEEEALNKALATIKELETELNSRTKTLEDLKVKVEKLESEVSIKDKELEDKEKTTEERILELEDKIDFLETKKPVLDKLLEADSDIDKKQVKWLKGQDVSYIEGRLEKALEKAESQIVIKDLEETAGEAKLEKEKEEKKMEKVTYDQFTSHIGKIGNTREV